MPLLLLSLGLGVLAYFVWRARASGLTRNCRWRQNRKRENWRCAFCGAESESAYMPRICRRGADRG